MLEKRNGSKESVAQAPVEVLVHQKDIARQGRTLGGTTFQRREARIKARTARGPQSARRTVSRSQLESRLGGKNRRCEIKEGARPLSLKSHLGRNATKNLQLEKGRVTQGKNSETRREVAAKES